MFTSYWLKLNHMTLGDDKGHRGKELCVEKEQEIG